MKAHIVLAFLIISLASCVPAAIVASPTNTSVPAPTYTPVQPTPTLELTLAPSTPLPTEPTIPILTPDAIQVARWEEYQTALAKCVLSFGGCDYSNPESVLCEWDILGRSDQELYVWAECLDTNAAGRAPLLIYLETDGSIQKVRFGGYKGQDYNLELFPAYVREKIFLYTNSINSARTLELRSHLTWREEHRDQPPLIVLNATPAP